MNSVDFVIGIKIATPGEDMDLMASFGQSQTAGGAAAAPSGWG